MDVESQNERLSGSTNGVSLAQSFHRHRLLKEETSKPLFFSEAEKSKGD